MFQDVLWEKNGSFWLKFAGWVVLDSVMLKQTKKVRRPSTYTSDGVVLLAKVYFLVILLVLFTCRVVWRWSSPRRNNYHLWYVVRWTPCKWTFGTDAVNFYPLDVGEGGESLERSGEKTKKSTLYKTLYLFWGAVEEGKGEVRVFFKRLIVKKTRFHVPI